MKPHLRLSQIEVTIGVLLGHGKMKLPFEDSKSSSSNLFPENLYLKWLRRYIRKLEFISAISRKLDVMKLIVYTATKVLQ